MSTSERGGQPYHHGDLRRALVTAAREILEEAGPESLSLRDVARRVGVSHNAPYRHFPTRQALLAAVAADGFAILSARLAKIPAGSGMAAGFRGYLGFAREQPGLYRLMFDGGLRKSADPALWTVGERAYDGLRQAVLSLAPGADRAAVVAAWAQLHGLALLIISGQLADDLVSDSGLDALAGRVGAILEAGLRGAGAP
ncbi:TetR/AcrR family transcriptional regulator [Inquilinus sp. Marseille-Q2685]|uniref:TetR/AcrR family transcriptional regulator n=1 Tax=Inquilinus sp. Marseille-Q2685 TaxID=2866581 RepID=UPI001CE47E11|nr:TetR/AcrR family transcriptional regulator [Inquilinus sp. Marseille-Q2685]